MFRRAATLAAGLALVAVAAALFSPTRAAAACPAETYCTDESGKYTLTVPPLTGPIYGAFADCVWQVHVNFGDGTGADYVFEGDKGLSGSYTFPSYGTYHVSVALSNGYHKNSPTHEACPPYTQTATVLYRDPSKAAEEEAKEKQEKEEKEKSPGEKPNEAPGGGGQPTGSGGGKSTAQEEGTSGNSGPSHPIHVWRDCSHDVYAHRVACRKAQRVIKGAQDKLSERKTARVAGFRCHLTDDLRPISCRRGKGRVLGPLG